MKTLVRRSAVRLFATVLLIQIGVTASFAQVSVNDPNFTHEFLYFGNGITAMQFDPDGNLWGAEKQGRLLRFSESSGSLTPETMLDLTGSVNPALEGGFIGFVFDPDFDTNGFLYLHYTTNSDQRIVRLTYDSMMDSISPATETNILTGLPHAESFHKGGDIDFDPTDNDHLIVALGDDGNPSRAQNLDFYEGKYLRIDKATGLGVSSNPFYDGDPDSVRSRIWLSGLRNPFRFAFHPSVPVSNVLYISENGDATDRISWARSGSDGNWNSNGDGSISCVGGCFLNPADPNHRVMVAIEPSQIGIVIATSGPFAVSGNPTLYAGNWFPNEYSIRRYTLSGTDLDVATDVDGSSPFVNNLVGVDLQFGDDGCLYTSSSNGDAALNAGSIERVCFTAGTPPVANFSNTPDPITGVAPLQVQFTDQSSDVDGSIASYDWDFGDGNGSSVANPSHTYNTPGNYTVRLTVTDDVGLTDFLERSATVSASGNVSLQVTVRDASNLPDTALNEMVTLALFQRDGTTPIAFTGGTGTDGNEILTQSDGTIDQLLDLNFVDDGLIVAVNPDQSFGVGQTRFGASFPAQSPPATINRTVYLAPAMIRGEVSTTTGDVPQVDVGVNSNGMPYTVAGGRDHTDQPTGILHRVDTDSAGYFTLPIRIADVPGTFSLDTPGDTNEDQYGDVILDTTLTQAETLPANILLGVLGGGQGCDDLSGISTTVATNEAVQAVFDAQCNACHTPTATNSGGLDLTQRAKANLASRDSAFAPGVPLMTGNDLDSSYLFEKINCATPQTGDRMRPTNSLPLVDQALIRDWILDHVFISDFE